MEIEKELMFRGAETLERRVSLSAQIYGFSSKHFQVVFTNERRNVSYELQFELIRLEQILRALKN